jgi:two-component system, NarL family, nitrate/nitrite response regulator NarL
VRLDLCDDSRILCEALSVALEARGHQVLAAATTTTLGVTEVAAHQPDVRLLDLRFPDPADDLGAAGMIRRPCPGIAVPLLPGVAKRALIADPPVSAGAHSKLESVSEMMQIIHVR